MSAGDERPEPREIEREQIAALVRGERVQLVEDDEFERAEQLGRALMRQHQRDLLRRGQQNVGREHALAGAAGGRRVAGPGFEPDRQPHLLHGRGEVPRDIDGERLQRRDVEGVDRASRALACRGRRARSVEARQEAGQRLAAAGRRDQQRVAPRPGLREQRQLVGMRAASPAP